MAQRDVRIVWTPDTLRSFVVHNLVEIRGRHVIQDPGATCRALVESAALFGQADGVTHDEFLAEARRAWEHAENADRLRRKNALTVLGGNGAANPAGRTPLD